MVGKIVRNRIGRPPHEVAVAPGEYEKSPPEYNGKVPPPQRCKGRCSWFGNVLLARIADLVSSKDSTPQGSDMKSSTTTTGRLIIADDNIRDVGGHYFELAGLLLAGARELGYEGVLATHSSFAESAAVLPVRQVIPTFHTRRLVHWSLGVDGHSRFQRDHGGRSIGGSPAENAWTNLTDLLQPKRRPLTMLRQWSDDLARLLTELQPTSSDSLLINTGDDFALLALAAAMKKCGVDRMRIDVIFHFALYHSSQPDRKERLRQMGRQIRSAVTDLQAHDLHLHATTQNLANQLRETESGARFNAIPYPTRACQLATGSPGRPWKAVLAGLPRAEKGRGAIIELLTAMEPGALKQRHFRVSLQMPAQRWQAMIPVALHGAYQRRRRIGSRADRGDDR